MMHIVVCMKQIIGSEEKIEIKDGRVSEENVEFVINPYDEYAIEEAIRIKEQFGGEVTVITIGPERAEKALRTALAMGADKGVHIDDPELFGDEALLSKVLAQTIRKMGFDLILAGNFAMDTGSGQTAIRLAEELDIPHIGSVVELKLDGSKVTAKRDIEGDIEVVEGSFPLLITAQQGLNDPRYPSLPGIMKAKKKPLNEKTAGDYGVDVSPRLEVLKTREPEGRKAGIRVGSVDELVGKLKEAGVI